jgi:SSS family solute:Na+ symporter
VHLGFSLLLIATIIIFKYSIGDASVIAELFTLAGYTYGPLLGLYAFGLFTNWRVRDRFVPWVAIIAPALSYGINVYVSKTFGYNFSFEHIIINGLLTFIGLSILIKKS